jgi:hypothetical protein
MDCGTCLRSALVLGGTKGGRPVRWNQLVGFGMALVAVILLTPPVEVFINELSPACVTNSMNCTNSVFIFPLALILLAVGILIFLWNLNLPLESRQVSDESYYGDE